MNRPTAKIVVTNNLNRSLVVYVEPWGEDYTLLSEEYMEVIAVGTASAPWFSIVESNAGTLLHIEGDAVESTVYQGETRLECGHNRVR